MSTFIMIILFTVLFVLILINDLNGSVRFLSFPFRTKKCINRTGSTTFFSNQIIYNSEHRKRLNNTHIIITLS